MTNLEIEQKMSSVQTEMMNLRSSVEDDKIKFEEKLVLLEWQFNKFQETAINSMVSSNEDIENILMPLIDDLAPKLKQEIKEELTGPLNVAWHAILLIKSMNMIPLFWSFF